jgi:tetratricopeptide (TPR) repeat protein
MAVLKCKMCGGDIQASDGAAYGTCGSCGTTSTLPKASGEKVVNLFNRANHFRRLNEFDKALTVYENILNEDNASAEAHWGAALCRYGIEYVEDPLTHERIPTCRRAQFEPILSDPDYLAALEHASDEYTKSLYEKEAKTISEIQKGILAISSREEPYDVFICYKETTDGGSRTKDSTIAQDIYYELTKDGYKVFFAKITLEDKLGQEYEPYIFSALNSAKVMLVIGTRKEHFEAVWVKNEWSRFLALMKKDRSRLLIPCYKDMDAYDIPDELSNLQSQDMSKVGFMQDILRGVKKVLDASKPIGKTSSATAAGTTPATPGVESLMKRGKLFLEDSDWKQADEYFDRVLDIDPEYALAYIGKLCAKLNVRQEEQLGENAIPLTEYSQYQKAVRFADADYRVIVEKYNKTIQERLAEEERLEREQERQEKERIANEERIDKERREEHKRNLPKILERIAKYKYRIAAGYRATYIVTVDGTVVMFSTLVQFDKIISGWRDIVAISECGDAGLKTNGTVVAVNINGECNIAGWRDIIAISGPSPHIVGLKSDGTVVTVNRSCDRNIADWRDIIAISAGNNYTVGLKANGTVITTGYDSDGRCDVSDWRDIVAISAGRYHNHIVGLKSDGTVVIADSGGSVCTQRDVANWRDIVAISNGEDHVVGLKADGTVIAAGYNYDGECNVSDWRDIVAISTHGGYSPRHTVGLKTDGTVVAVGNNDAEQCNVSTEFLQSDTEQCNVSREFLQSKRWQQQGLCPNCGGQIGGIFTKKCISCGKEQYLMV